MEGVVRGSVGPEGGSVFIRGEFWNAESADTIEDGAHVRVDGVDGLKLRVRRASH